MNQRPAFIRHYTELPSSRWVYPGETEQMSEGTPLSRSLGLQRLGVHHELLPPGTRTSWPHAEEKEEELIFVLEGEPDVWIDGVIYPLQAGDVVAFPPGTGIAHTFINNSDRPARLLVIGETIADSGSFYVFQPEGWQGMPAENLWKSPPPRERGSHDGLPDQLRKLKENDLLL